MRSRIILTSLFLTATIGCGGPTKSKALSFESYDEKGKIVKLEDLKGKVVVFDFWATWCGPCREFVPFVREIHQKYGPKGVQVVAITDENRGAIASYEKNAKSGYPLFMDTDQSVNIAFEVQGYPTMVVLSKQGEVLYKGHPAKRAEIVEIIESALKG